MAIDDKIYFQTFLNAMKWADNASDKDKLHAIFSFFNHGEYVVLLFIYRVSTLLTEHKLMGGAIAQKVERSTLLRAGKFEGAVRKRSDASSQLCHCLYKLTL